MDDDEYISREAVVRYLKGYSEKECNSNSPYGMITSSVLNKAERALSEMPTADVLPVRLILQIVQGRLNGVNYIMSEAIKSNDTDTAYKMKGANDICNEILADLKALTATET